MGLTTRPRPNIELDETLEVEVDDQYEYDDGDDDFEDLEEQDTNEKKKRKSHDIPRKLMRWNPDKDQLVLLQVEAICAKDGIAIPWDKIAKSIAPTMTGEAIKQHLTKVSRARVADGRPVPEKATKSTRGPSKDQSAAAATKASFKIKKEDGDEDDTVQGNTLLYWGPGVMKVAGQNPKTPKKQTGSAMKKAQSDVAADAILTAPTKVAPAKSAKLTNTSNSSKRGRGTAKKAKNVDPEDESDVMETPVKKPKTAPRRAKKAVNYTEVPEIDGDEDILLADPNAGVYDEQVRNQADDEDARSQTLRLSQSSVRYRGSQGDFANDDVFGPADPFNTSPNQPIPGATFGGHGGLPFGNGYVGDSTTMPQGAMDNGGHALPNMMSMAGSNPFGFVPTEDAYDLPAMIPKSGNSGAKKRTKKHNGGNMVQQYEQGGLLNGMQNIQSQVQSYGPAPMGANQVATMGGNPMMTDADISDALQNLPPAELQLLFQALNATAPNNQQVKFNSSNGTTTPNTQHFIPYTIQNFGSATQAQTNFDFGFNPNVVQGADIPHTSPSNGYGAFEGIAGNDLRLNPSLAQGAQVPHTTSPTSYAGWEGIDNTPRGNQFQYGYGGQQIQQINHNNSFNSVRSSMDSSVTASKSTAATPFTPNAQDGDFIPSDDGDAKPSLVNPHFDPSLGGEFEDFFFS